MNLEKFAESANQRLLEHTEHFLIDTDQEFRENILYAINIAAPLRERGYLMYLAAGICKVEWNRVERFAHTIELLMSAAFTADDIFDKASRRSNSKSLLAKTNSTKAFLIAEMLHSISYKNLLEWEYDFSDKLFNNIFYELNHAFDQLIYYQYLCSSLEGEKRIGLELIDKLARGRTGRLIELCLTIPAMIAEASRLQDDLGQCGHWLGIALQHRDDILDFISSPDVLGKPILLDLFNGQPNIVLVHAFSAENNYATKQDIERIFNNSQKRDNSYNHIEDTQNQVLSILRETQSLDYARNVVANYCKLALDKLVAIEKSQFKKELIDTIQTIAQIEFPWESSNDR